MSTPLFLTAFAMLTVAILATTRSAKPAARPRTPQPEAAGPVRRPVTPTYDDVAVHLAADLDAGAVADVLTDARTRGVPAPLLHCWTRRHGGAVTADAVHAGLSVAQFHRHARSLAGLDLESVALQAELRQWAVGGAGR